MCEDNFEIENSKCNQKILKPLWFSKSKPEASVQTPGQTSLGRFLVKTLRVNKIAMKKFLKNSSSPPLMYKN